MTLLELMVVVAIVGLFASMSVVGFQKMTERQRVSGAQRELLMVMQEARQKARSTYQPVRLALRTVGAVRYLRWEALPCNNKWGSICPVPACQTAACGASGCTCPELGLDMVVPPGLDVSSLVGLCWMGDSAQPAVVVPVSAGAATCVRPGIAPTAGQLVLKRNWGTTAAPQWKNDLVFQVDALTGAVRSVDCGKYPTTTGCI